MVRRFQQTSKRHLQGLIAAPAPKIIILIGFMGVGKTEIGKLCAIELGCEFYDTDEMVQARAGMTISEIFAAFGESEFRRLEKSSIGEAVARQSAVIATGGGAPLDPDNRAALTSAGIVVHLTARARTIAHRIGDAASRPLLASEADPFSHIKRLMVKRRPAYASMADITIPVEANTPLEIARQIASRVADTSKLAKEVLTSSAILQADVGDGGYPIWLGSGLIRIGGGRLLARLAGRARACIVTHPHLKQRYAEPIAYEMRQSGVPVAIVTLPQGESRKNLKTVQRLYSSFVAAGIDRNGLVVAVGGGVIGDIAGFAAACFLRGVRYAQVPTTLLAQVDSSVGGKTGVDLPEGKNLVGSFHQPALVLIDPEALCTLPQRELRSGLAEVIKYGIITDEAFFYQTRDELPSILNRDLDALKRAIMRSCEIKAAVVAADEKEQGLRAILNFGHTVGHALESVTLYKRYRHGEAIAIGMVTASLIGEELGITPQGVTRELTSCLSACSLPVEFPAQIDISTVYAAMLLDKKTQSGRLRFVIAEGIGKVRVVDGVPQEVVYRAIERQKPSQ